MTYRPPQFRTDDPDVLLPLLQRFPFAALMTVENGEIDLTNLPLLARTDAGTIVLEGHIARANPQWKTVATHALALFQIASHYISPSWYPSKQSDPRTVPTYDYVSIQVRGHLRFVHDATWLDDLVRRLTAQEEARLGTTWSVDDAPPEYIHSQLAAIVGIELKATRLTGTFKLNQHHPQPNKHGIRAGLESTGTPAATAMKPFIEDTLPP